MILCPNCHKHLEPDRSEFVNDNLEIGDCVNCGVIFEVHHDIKHGITDVKIINCKESETK